MTKRIEISAAQLYWDAQDHQAQGWVLNYRDEKEQPVTAEIDGEEDADTEDLMLAVEHYFNRTYASRIVSGRVALYRGQLVEKRFELIGIPSEEDQIARDAQLVGRAEESVTIGNQLMETDAERTERLVTEMARLPTYQGWRFTYEYPGFFCYHHAALPFSVFFTPDWEAAEQLPVEVQDSNGQTLTAHCAVIPLPAGGRTGRQIFGLVQPTLDKLLKENPL